MRMKLNRGLFLFPIGEEGSLVEHMFCLACGTLDVAWFLDVDVRLDAHQTDDAVVEGFDEWHLLGWVRREVFGTQLDIEVEGVFVVLAVNGDEVLWCEDGELCQHGLYLRREDVYASDDEHVVAASQNLSESDGGASAFAWLVDEVGEVAGAVAEDGHGFFAEGGEDQLALFAGFYWLQGLWIDDFWIEHVFGHMCAVLVLAFTAYTGATHFGESIDVDGLDVQLLLQLSADAPCPRFGSEESYSEFQVFRLDFRMLFYHLSQMQGVGRGAAEGGCAEVFHQHDLLGGVACRDGQLNGSTHGGSVVST